MRRSCSEGGARSRFFMGEGASDEASDVLFGRKAMLTGRTGPGRSVCLASSSLACAPSNGCLIRATLLSGTLKPGSSCALATCGWKWSSRFGTPPFGSTA